MTRILVWTTCLKNISAINLNLAGEGSKKPFVMQICRLEESNNDFSAKVVFSTTK